MNRLANEGFNDYKHIYERFKEHESSGAHMSFMSKCINLQIRFKKNITFDKHFQEIIRNEKRHWKDVLLRIVYVTRYLV